MSPLLPTTFYHSVSQSRLRDAVNKDALPGLSTFHLDAKGNRPGIWITNDLRFVAKNGRYGGEQSDEVLDTWDAATMAKITGNPDAQPLVIKKPIHPIRLELKDMEDDRLLQHPLFPEQFFYYGDLDWSKVKNFRFVENDTETESVARELAETLAKRGIEVGVESYKYSEAEDLDRFEKKEIKNDFLKDILRHDREGKL